MVGTHKATPLADHDHDRHHYYRQVGTRWNKVARDHMVSHCHHYYRQVGTRWNKVARDHMVSNWCN